MIFLIESVVACLILTLLIKLISHNRQEVFTNDYPPVVTDKLREMGLIAEKPPAKKKDMIRKLTAMAVFALLFALLMHYVNGISAFDKSAVIFHFKGSIKGMFLGILCALLVGLIVPLL